MKTLHVATGKPYNILIERGIINSCGKYIRNVSKAKKQWLYQIRMFFQYMVKES